VSVSVSVFGVCCIQHKKEESLKLVGVSGFFMELLARFELATSSLPRVEGLRPSGNALPAEQNTLKLNDFLRSAKFALVLDTKSRPHLYFTERL